MKYSDFHELGSEAAVKVRRSECVCVSVCVWGGGVFRERCELSVYRFVLRCGALIDLCITVWIV